MPNVDIGGCELFVEDSGTGEVLLLVHGFPLDHTMWRFQIDHFAQTHRVIAPDLRGFGRSAPPLRVMRMGQFANELAAMLDALDITEPINYCGLSMGGYIGWEFWRLHGKRLARLIQCDTKAEADSMDGQAMRIKSANLVLEVGSKPIVETILPKLFAESTRQTSPALVKSIEQGMIDTSPESIAAAQRGMAQRADATVWLAEINVPTLAICGEHDEITPADNMREMASAMPNASFVRISKAGHMAPLEQPNAVNAAIREFLAR